jgi:hypothetical protein
MIDKDGLFLFRLAIITADFREMVNGSSRDHNDVIKLRPNHAEDLARKYEELSGVEYLPGFNAQLKRIAAFYRSGGTQAEYQFMARALKERIEDDLEKVWFFRLSNGAEALYTNSQPFGSEVNDAFPGAIDDIEGAAKCLALEQGTATVLHLMRVMEVGLRALAKALGIPYAPSWESYLLQISTKIAAKHKTKGVKWKRDEPFFRDVSGDLITIKQAFRNPTMHVGRKYSPDEAREIYHAVCIFMQRLATRLSLKPSSRGRPS